VGVVISNAYGSLEAIHELHSVAVLEDPRYINPSRFPLTVSNSAAGYISIWEDLHALNVTVSDGNCGGLDAVGCADLLLAAGRADVLLVGGAEALSEPLLVGLRRLGAAGPTGLRIGEGCALVVLESPENAARRGATALAEIVGYAAAFAPPPHAGQLVHASADALEQAIRQALDDAGVQPQEIDLVVSAASGIAAFDDAEQRAVERVLGEGACVVAPKRALGETFGAGGGMAMLAAVAYLQGGARSHVVRGELRGPAKELRTALITAPGYYGNAAALVMRAPSR
jgi:3-oxoacyl-(acyl-carrier-protein) synthase